VCGSRPDVARSRLRTQQVGLVRANGCGLPQRQQTGNSMGACANPLHIAYARRESHINFASLRYRYEMILSGKSNAIRGHVAFGSSVDTASRRCQDRNEAGGDPQRTSRGPSRLACLECQIVRRHPKIWGWTRAQAEQK